MRYNQVMSDLAPFAAWLRRRRKTLDLTREQLAQRAHCSVSTIRRLEAADLRASKQLAGSLAAALAVPADQHATFVEFARGSRTRFDGGQQSADGGQSAVVRRSPSAVAFLPAPLTSFVGRKRELRAVCELLRQPSVRLLTLTGPPGTGKTRLAIAVAHEVTADFGDGAHFVSLSPISDAALLAVTIAQSLEVRESGRETLSDALRRFLHDKSLLLVLDNFEQVVAAAPLLTELLLSAPRVKALVTSREVLRVYGEHEYPVPALDFPDAHHLPSTQARSFYARFPSILLFAERARATQPSFKLSPDNLSDVARICAWLDGLPLAIEMAAAHVKWLPTAQLFEQLSSRLVLLTGGPRDQSPRQQSLSGAIDWSYERLDADEQTLFERLSVFVGGCDDEAISDQSVEIGDLKAGAARSQRSTLHALVEKSLLRYELSRAGAPRYTMLESIREYAYAKLEARGQLERARQLHAEHYLRLAQTAKPHLLSGGEQAQWLNRLELEHNNLRAALTWASVSRERSELALNLVDMLYHFWHVRGYLSEGRTWMAKALALDDAPSEVRARVLNYSGRLAQLQGDFQSAQQNQEEALEIQQYLGDESGMCRSLETLAIIGGSQGDYAHAGELMEKALVVRRRLGDKPALLPPLNNLAIVQRRLGNLLRAEEFYRECATVSREIDAPKPLSHALHGLAEVRYDLGDYAEALSLLRESIAIRQQLGNRTDLANSFGVIGMTLYRLGDGESAARLIGASLKLSEELGTVVSPANRGEVERNIALVRTLLGDALFERMWAEGRALNVDDAVRLALSAFPTMTAPEQTD